MKREMGFNADVTKVDEIRTTEEYRKQNRKNFRKVVIGVGLFVATIGFGINTMWDNYQERQSERIAYSEKMDKVREEKKAEKAEATKKYEEGKRLTAQFTSNEVARASIVDTFNSEIRSTPENEIFDFKFKNIDGQLTLEVDIIKASAYFGVDENTTRLGVSQGSDVYTSYVKRFNAKENKNSTLQIVDNYGKLIVEVK